MTTELVVTYEARLREALNRETYYQQRSEALSQHLINRDKDIAALQKQMEEQEIALKAEIADLQDQLRVGRRERVAAENLVGGAAHGE